MHQNVDFTHMIVRYDTEDVQVAVTVCYATCEEEAQILLRVFKELAWSFAPTALYAIRSIELVDRYQKRDWEQGR